MDMPKHFLSDAQLNASDIPASAFSKTVLEWFDEFGRKDLPWQQSRDAYSIWISEIMLQQTQVTTVIPYYERFMASFPDVQSLAAAEQDDVLHHWTGLGYYARARNLHKSAKLICSEYAGIFPTDIDSLVDLPGIGLSTAGAVLSFSTNQRHPILDGNVKRVLCRYFGVEGWPGKSSVQKELWQLANENTPSDRVAEYTQAIMDFGATQCKRHSPDCNLCPLKDSCYALNEGQVKSLPSKKPRKIVPVRQSILLLLLNDSNEPLLIKRPPSGIWGGLWCLPELPFDGELPNDKQIQDWVEDEFGLMIDEVSPKHVFRHTFSHFHLDITALNAQLSEQTSPQINDQAYIWFNHSKDLQIGLAAPIKKLLNLH